MTWHRTWRVISGIPTEIWWRIRRKRWVLDREIRHYDEQTGKTLTAPTCMEYDKATLFPNLLKLDGSDSDGWPIHDRAWTTGTWDDGTEITFDDSNRVLRDILINERQRGWIVRAVNRGVSLPIMRYLWRRKFHHA